MAKLNRQNRGKGQTKEKDLLALTDNLKSLIASMESRMIKEDLFIGGKKLEEEPPEELETVHGMKKISADGKGEYKIVNPYRLYRGKSYSNWITDWFNWFLSADADKHNSGPVVFLHSYGKKNRITGTSNVPGQVTTVTDTLSGSQNGGMEEYRVAYVNDPNIRIGSDRLQIFDDQTVFFPVIKAYAFASIEPYNDWGRMQDFTGLTTDYGDNPPDISQITINNQNINLPNGLGMEEFRFTTPIFTAVVPETQYGRSMKDFTEDAPIPSGSFPALCEGYYFMLKFSPGSYWVHSWASAPRERTGPYFSELLYQIEVSERRSREPHKGFITEGLRDKRDSHKGFISGDRATVVRPPPNERVFNQTFYEKIKIGELTEPEISRFKKFFSSLPTNI
jgi:hypothetical protein